MKKFKIINKGILNKVEGYVYDINPEFLTITLYFIVKVKEDSLLNKDELSLYIYNKLNTDSIQNKLIKIFPESEFPLDKPVTFNSENTLKKITKKHKPNKSNYSLNVIFKIPKNYKNYTNDYFNELVDILLKLDIFKSDKVIEFIEGSNGKIRSTEKIR
jgi:hypothetical protein